MKQKLHFLYIWFDYEILLPLLALLPNKLGRYIAKLRGILYFYKRRDWRSFTFGDVELWDRTYTSYEQMFPSGTPQNILALVRERFIYQSLEEFEAAKINNRTYMKIPVEYVGKEDVEMYLQNHQNVIFATCHFGSIVGLINLHVFGQKMLHMASNVTKQKHVHPSITKFYIKKYRIGNEYMNGGSIVDVEGNNKQFLKCLKEGGSLSTVADLPAPNPQNEAFWEIFFGKYRAFATGIHRLSAAYNTKIIPYVCYFECGRYVMKFGSLNENIYTFFEKEIRERPGMWWASDLLSHYAAKESHEL